MIEECICQLSQMVITVAVTKMIQSLQQGDGPTLMLHTMLPMFMTLFFLEALRLFLGLIYFLNLGAMTIGLSVMYLFLLLSPIAVVFLKRIGPYRLAMYCAWGVVFFRLLMAVPTFDSSLSLITSGLVAMLFGIFLTAIVVTPLKISSEHLPDNMTRIVIGTALGMAADLMLRTINATFDVTISSNALLFTIPLVVLAAIVILMTHSVCKENIGEGESITLSKGGRLKKLFLGAGYGGWLFLVNTFFAFPNVIARWTATSYEVGVISVLVAVLAYAMFFQIPRARGIILRREIVIILNLIFLIAAVDAIFIHSIFVPFLEGIAVFTLLVNLGIMWRTVRGDLVTSGLYHFFGMFLFLFLTLFFVISFTAGMILPALEGFIPYILMFAVVLVFLISTGSILLQHPTEVTE